MIATLPASPPGPNGATRAEDAPERAAFERMPLDASNVPEATAAVEHPPLEWVFNPWRQSVRTWLVTTLVAASITAMVAGFALPMLARVALALAFLGSLHRELFPTRCRVDGSGVACRVPFGWERRPWSAIRRASLHPGALIVSTTPDPGPLETFRQLRLPIPPDAPPALWNRLREHLARHGL